MFKSVAVAFAYVESESVLVLIFHFLNLKSKLMRIMLPQSGHFQILEELPS